MDPDTRIRAASAADIETLVEFRAEMFREQGWHDEARILELKPRYREWVLKHLASGDFVGWVTETTGRPVGTVGLLWENVPPTVRNLSGRQAYLMALYVQADARRQGAGRRLAEVAISHAKANGADVVSLHATPEGHSLYARMGFAESPEMRLFTDPLSAAATMSDGGYAPDPEDVG